MIGDLLNRLVGEPSSEPLSQEDEHLAMAALMVRLSRTDGNYTAEERAMIERTLARRYGLDAAGATALRRDAEAAEADAPDTVQFTRLVKAAVPYEEREGVLESLWTVAITDGIEADERGFLRLVANLLGVSDRDSGLARQRAQRAATG